MTELRHLAQIVEHVATVDSHARAAMLKRFGGLMSSSNQPSTRRKRILVVAGDPQLRRAFAAALDAFDVRPAEPEEALAVLRKGEFDALVYDVTACRDEALSFVDALTVEQWERLLVLDAPHAEDDLARRVRDNTIGKPVSADALRISVELVLRRGRRRSSPSVRSAHESGAAPGTK